MMEKLKLYNGVEMPIIGFGVFQINDHQMCEEAVYNAIKVGYRMIDTAYMYGNEQAVGNAIARAINDKLVTRQELFIVTKI
jgi:diketogulonate reductase-like aldo/keto reductase